MKNLLLGLVLLVLFTSSCEDEKVTSDCTQPIYLKEESAIISDPFQITSAVINGNCLEVEVGAGGCDGESWESNLFVFPLVAESLPPQVSVEFSLKDEELCEAYIRKSFSFDLSGLYSISESVIVNLNGWEELLLLENRSVDISQIARKWNLINVNGGLQGTDLQFEPGDITWNFNSSMVEIINNTQDNTGVGFKPGTFDYTITQSEVYVDRYELEIDGHSLGPITNLTSDKLVVDLRPVDGLQYVLESLE